MIDSGDIYVADLGGETADHVLVLSNLELHRRSSRVLVAPEWRVADIEVQFPWFVAAEDKVFAVDHLQSVLAENLLRRVGRAPYRTVMAARRALIAIT